MNNIIKTAIGKTIKFFLYIIISMLFISSVTNILVRLLVDYSLYSESITNLVLSMIFTNFSITPFRYFLNTTRNSEKTVLTAISGVLLILTGASTILFSFILLGAIYEFPKNRWFLIGIIVVILITFIQMISTLKENHELQIKKKAELAEKNEIKRKERIEEIKRTEQENLHKKELLLFEEITDLRKKSEKTDEAIISFVKYSTYQYDNSKKDISDINEYNSKLKEFSKYINLTSEQSSVFKKYLEQEKKIVYANTMGDELSLVLDFETSLLEEIVEKYYEIYGSRAFSDHNIESLSMITNQDPSMISLMIKDLQLNAEYLNEKRITENRLFGRSTMVQNKDLEIMNGFEFEDFLNELFIDMGYETETLPYTGDYGADLIVLWNHKRIVIQAKKYAEGNATSLPAIQEVQSAKSYYDGDLAMVITTSHFTKNASVLAERTGVSLIDGKKLKKLIAEKNTYFSELVSADINKII